MENNELADTYESKSLITRLYFKTKVWTAIKMAHLSKKDIILDYGCGGGWLEKKLKGFRIYGYDINPKKTFIKDYKEINPTKIFVLDVFEHVPIKEIEKILANFKKMGNFELIVSLPTENWISRKMRKMVGKTEVPKEHITRYYDVVNLLKKLFTLKKKINFFTVCHIYNFSN